MNETEVEVCHAVTAARFLVSLFLSWLCVGAAGVSSESNAQCPLFSPWGPDVFPAVFPERMNITCFLSPALGHRRYSVSGPLDFITCSVPQTGASSKWTGCFSFWMFDTLVGSFWEAHTLLCT